MDESVRLCFERELRAGAYMSSSSPLLESASLARERGGLRQMLLDGGVERCQLRSQSLGIGRVDERLQQPAGLQVRRDLGLYVESVHNVLSSADQLRDDGFALLAERGRDVTRLGSDALRVGQIEQRIPRGPVLVNHFLGKGTSALIRQQRQSGARLIDLTGVERIRNEDDLAIAQAVNGECSDSLVLQSRGGVRPLRPLHRRVALLVLYSCIRAVAAAPVFSSARRVPHSR